MKHRATSRPESIRQRRLQMIRDSLIARDKQTCQHCGRTSDSPRIGPDGRWWNIDHLIPHSRGGSDEPENLVLSCHTCNLRKGVALVDSWKAPRRRPNTPDRYLVQRYLRCKDRIRCSDPSLDRTLPVTNLLGVLGLQLCDLTADILAATVPFSFQNGSFYLRGNDALTLLDVLYGRYHPAALEAVRMEERTREVVRKVVVLVEPAVSDLNGEARCPAPTDQP